MYKRFTILLLFIALGLVVKAKTIYVKVDGQGDGTSWLNATNDVQVALNKATSGDKIFVASGVYFPTKDNDRTISFTPKNGVALYGGFAGTETSIGERIINTNITVLSGEIGTQQKTDNTFNVLYLAHATETTIIDGFIITGGYAGGDDASGVRFSSGGGLYNDASNGYSKLIIDNCRFIENTARDGAAIYNNASNVGFAEMMINNCKFQNNKAFLGGGAIFNNGKQQGKCVLSMNANTLVYNTAGFGGAIFNMGTEGKCLVKINESKFSNNKAMIQGGGIFNLSDGGISKTILTNCEFKNNKAPKGSTVANSQASLSDKPNMTKI